MAFPGLNRFKAELREGARANYFDVQLFWPAGSPLGFEGARSMQFMCHSATLPGMTQGSFTVKYFGRDIHYAGDRSFGGSVSFGIINDEQFKIRRAVESWMSEMTATESNLSVRRMATGIGGYSATAIVRQYSRNGSIIRQYRFHDVFPTNIADINLSWGDARGFEEYNVQMAYNWWEPFVGAGARDVVVNI